MSHSIAIVREGMEPILFPNPASDFIQWSGISAVTDMVLLDATGRQVYSANVTDVGVPRIDIVHLANGPYSCLALDGAGTIVARSRFLKVQAPMVR